MEKSDLLNQLRIDRSAPAAAPASTRTPLVLGGVMAALVLGGVGVWLFARDGALAVETRPVRAIASAPVQASVLDATGYITARRLATVSAKVTGRVKTLSIEEGMRVEEGQVLATLDATDEQAARALSAARLDAARSQLAEIRANLANAEREAKRQDDLVARKLASAQAADAARTTVAALRARLASAEREVVVAERSLAIADLDLDNTIVRAPFAGVVTVKAAQPGEIISPLSAGGGFTRTGIGTIVDMDSLEIQVDVNENFINRVMPGQPVEATLNAYPDWKIPAEVIAIIPTADRSKATVKVRIALKEKDARIVPDMGVRVAFLEERKADAAPAEAPKGVLVPRAALRREGSEDVAYVLADGRLARRVVQVGALTAGEARQVLDGVAAGERVVVAPADGLADGAPAAEKTP
ncbi:MAG: efflux RND transporter periplasmic adaptor subunit [Xanthomonadaceae bacterium]|nr:efflux RND transporter periplasmic adaptor subunit [Xanthomonadaceae bacterium]